MTFQSKFKNPTSKIRKGLLAFCLLSAAAAILPPSGFSHKLSVFAWIDGNTVVVEGKLSGGKQPKQGMVYVYDGKEHLLLKTEIDSDGTARFLLPDYKTGLKIVMDVGGGHTSYWILTPYDIENQLTATEKK